MTTVPDHDGVSVLFIFHPDPYHCRTCGRALDNPSDPWSGDCGGDCSKCQLVVEMDIGDYPTVINIIRDVMRAMGHEV